MRWRETFYQDLYICWIGFPCNLGAISGCPKEKGTGFTQGRLCLAILFDFAEEGTEFLDGGRAVVVFYLEGRKAISIIPHKAPLPK